MYSKINNAYTYICSYLFFVLRLNVCTWRDSLSARLAFGTKPPNYDRTLRRLVFNWLINIMCRVLRKDCIAIYSHNVFFLEIYRLNSSIMWRFPKSKINAKYLENKNVLIFFFLEFPCKSKAFLRSGWRDWIT